MSRAKTILDDTLKHFELDLERGIMKATDEADYERMMKAAELLQKTRAEKPSAPTKQQQAEQEAFERRIAKFDQDRELEAREQERIKHQEFLKLEQENIALRKKLNNPDKPPSPLFRKYADDYLTFVGGSTLYPRTKKRYAAMLQTFQSFVGKKATLDDITPSMMLNFQTWLAKADPLTDRKGVTNRTIDEYTGVVSNVYKMVIKKLADNPVEGRLVKKKQRMKSVRKPFTPDELVRIFDPIVWNALRDPADFFVPILALLTGSRPASICQLRLGDIRMEGGILCIHYHDYIEGNSSKTEATNRIAPMHPLLEDVGFIRYLHDVKALKGSSAVTLVFPWLNKYEQGYADAPSQYFTKRLKTLLIYVKNVKVLYPCAIQPISG